MLVMGQTAIALWLLLSATSPRSAGAGNICGVVQDQTGAAIGDAALELRSEGTPVTARSDASGQFCLNRIESGDYRLTTRARNFRLDSRRVVIKADKSEWLTIVLTLETVTQQVTVAEGASDTSSINVAQTEVNQGLIQNLPSESVNKSFLRSARHAVSIPQADEHWDAKRCLLFSQTAFSKGGNSDSGVAARRVLYHRTNRSCIQFSMRGC